MIIIYGVLYLPISPDILMYVSVLGIRDILVCIRMRIRILGSIPLTNRSGCGSGIIVKSHKVTKQEIKVFLTIFP
jgi:hypothetical protein